MWKWLLLVLLKTKRIQPCCWYITCLCATCICVCMHVCICTHECMCVLAKARTLTKNTNAMKSLQKVYFGGKKPLKHAFSSSISQSNSAFALPFTNDFFFSKTKQCSNVTSHYWYHETEWMVQTISQYIILQTNFVCVCPVYALSRSSIL